MSTLKEKLNYLKDTKSLIKQAIIDKGGTAGDEFRTYAQAITDLPTDVTYTFDDLGYSQEARDCANAYWNSIGPTPTEEGKQLAMQVAYLVKSKGATSIQSVLGGIQFNEMLPAFDNFDPGVSGVTRLEARVIGDINFVTDKDITVDEYGLLSENIESVGNIECSRLTNPDKLGYNGFFPRNTGILKGLNKPIVISRDVTAESINRMFSDMGQCMDPENNYLDVGPNLSNITPEIKSAVETKGWTFDFKIPYAYLRYTEDDKAIAKKVYDELVAENPPITDTVKRQVSALKSHPEGMNWAGPLNSHSDPIYSNTYEKIILYPRYTFSDDMSYDEYYFEDLNPYFIPSINLNCWSGNWPFSLCSELRGVGVINLSNVSEVSFSMSGPGQFKPLPNWKYIGGFPGLKYGIDFTLLPNITKESIVNVFNTVDQAAGENNVFKIKKSIYDQLTAEEIKVVTDKGYVVENAMQNPIIKFNYQNPMYFSVYTADFSSQLYDAKTTPSQSEIITVDPGTKIAIIDFDRINNVLVNGVQTSIVDGQVMLTINEDTEIIFE